MGHIWAMFGPILFGLIGLIGIPISAIGENCLKAFCVYDGPFYNTSVVSDWVFPFVSVLATCKHDVVLGVLHEDALTPAWCWLDLGQGAIDCPGNIQPVNFVPPF